MLLSQWLSWYATRTHRRHVKTCKRENVKTAAHPEDGFRDGELSESARGILSYVQCLNPAPQDVEARFVGWLLPAAGLPQVVALLTEELVDNRS